MFNLTHKIFMENPIYIPISKYDLSKLLFSSVPKRHNMYQINYDLDKVLIKSDEITLDSSNMKQLFKDKYKKGGIHRFYCKKECELSENYKKILQLINEIIDSLIIDYKSKCINKNVKILPTYDNSYGIKVSSNGIIYNFIEYENKKYNIHINDLELIIKNSINCELFFCPEYFYILKDKDGIDKLKIGIILKSISIKKDQLDKLPQKNRIFIEQGLNKEIYEDSMRLNQIYYIKRKKYTTKQEIVENIMKKFNNS